MKRFLIAVIVSSFLIMGCKNGCSKKDSGSPGEDSTDVNLGEIPDSSQLHTSDSTQLVISKDSSLTGLTKEVLTIFKNKEYSKLDSFIHPMEGVRFSPYASVNPSTDKQFSPEEFQRLVTANKSKKVNWGEYDGSGDPILLTPQEYFKKFVYDANFVHPEKYGVNNVIKTGNSVNNLKSVYKESDFTESNFSGTKNGGGLDWKSVRLVFKQLNGRYYLVGIVHDQWTI